MHLISYKYFNSYLKEDVYVSFFYQNDAGNLTIIPSVYTSKKELMPNECIPKFIMHLIDKVLCEKMYSFIDDALIKCIQMRLYEELTLTLRDPYKKYEILTKNVISSHYLTALMGINYDIVIEKDTIQVLIKDAFKEQQYIKIFKKKDMMGNFSDPDLMHALIAFYVYTFFDEYDKAFLANLEKDILYYGNSAQLTFYNLIYQLLSYKNRNNDDQPLHVTTFTSKSIELIIKKVKALKYHNHQLLPVIENNECSFITRDCDHYY